MSEQSAPVLPISNAEKKKWSNNIWRFGIFRFFVDFQLWIPIWVIYLNETRGFSITEITFLDVLLMVILVILEVPTGIVADRWGRRVSLSYGAFIHAIAILVFSFAGNMAVIAISYTVVAVAITLFSGADSAFVYDSLKAAGRQDEYQKIWGRVYSISLVAGVVSLVLGAFLAAITNLWFPIVVSAGLMLLAWIVALTFKEPPRDEEPGSYREAILNAVNVVRSKPPVYTMMLFAGFVMAIAVSFQIFMQPYLRSHDIEIKFIGVLQVPEQLLGIVAALFAYRLVGLIGIGRTMLLCPVAIFVTAIGLGSFDHIAAFAFYPLAGVIFAMSFPVLSTYFNDRIPSASRATVLSIYQLTFSLFVVLFEPILGWLADTRDFPTAYMVAAIILAVGAPPLYIIWWQANRKEVLLEEEV